MHISSKVIFSSVSDMLISYYANKKSSPRLLSWQPSLILFNIPIESGSIKNLVLSNISRSHIDYIRLATGLHWPVKVKSSYVVLKFPDCAISYHVSTQPGVRVANHHR